MLSWPRRIKRQNKAAVITRCFCSFITPAHAQTRQRTSRSAISCSVARRVATELPYYFTAKATNRGAVRYGREQRFYSQDW